MGPEAMLLDNDCVSFISMLFLQVRNLLKMGPVANDRVISDLICIFRIHLGPRSDSRPHR